MQGNILVGIRLTIYFLTVIMSISFAFFYKYFRGNSSGELSSVVLRHYKFKVSTRWRAKASNFTVETASKSSTGQNNFPADVKCKLRLNILIFCCILFVKYENRDIFLSISSNNNMVMVVDNKYCRATSSPGIISICRLNIFGQKILVIFIRSSPQTGLLKSIIRKSLLWVKEICI